MENLFNKLSFVITSVWVGSLWSMLMVTSVLFNKIPSTYIAGALASDMFKFINYFGLFASGIIIFAGFKSYGLRVMKKAFLWITLFILLLVIISFFGIHPLLETLKVEALPREVMESVFADRYSSWHGIASAGYLLQCILGILLLIKMR